MEEMIAAISRRIITEDNKPGEPVRPAHEETDILELTESLSEDGSVRRLTPAAAQSTDRADSPGQSEPARSEATPESVRDPRRERIVSPAVSGAAAAAFAQLNTLPRERRREGELALGGADRTLEEIVREMLKPLLQTWLDENLPGIVERLVRAEIARVVGEAGLR